MIFIRPSLKRLLEKPENVLCRLNLPSQYNVVCRKRLAKKNTYAMLFSKYKNIEYNEEHGDPDDDDAIIIPKSYTILENQSYIFRKRIAFTGSYHGLLEFIFTIFFVSFKFIVYIFVMTYVFFSLSKYIIHSISNYLFARKYNPQLKNPEFLNSLYERLIFVKNAYEGTNKIVDFYSYYLTNETKDEIKNFKFPSFTESYTQIKKRLKIKDYIISNADQQVLNFIAENKDFLVPDNIVKIGVEEEKLSPYELELKTEIKNRYYAILDNISEEISDHMEKNVIRMIELDNITEYLLQSSSVEMLNPFERLDLLNNKKKAKHLYYYPEQPPRRQHDLFFLNFFYRYFKKRLQVFMKNDFDSYYEFHNSIYYGDSRHVYLATNEKRAINFDDETKKLEYEQYKKLKYLQYKLQHNNNITTLYNNFYFNAVVDELIYQDGSLLFDIDKHMSCWSTLDMDTTIFYERNLYPYMDFFCDHDIEFFLSKYIYDDLFFHTSYGEPFLLNKIAKRRRKRNARFNDLHYTRGLRYEKDLFYKPIQFNKKKNKKHFLNVNDDFFLNSQIQLDLDNFFIYMYMYLKEENSFIFIIIDKFISIFF